MKIRLTVVGLAIAVLLMACGGGTEKQNNPEKYFTIQGFAEGTYYRITYYDDERRNFQPEVEALLQRFERSLSVYDSTSIISRVNHNEDIEVDDYFITMFNRAVEINQQTDGAFDISGEPLFLAWGFSRKHQIPMDSRKVDSLLQYVGMDKIKLDGRRVVKNNPNIVINGNAIAKGYSSDIVAEFLDSKGSNAYLVDIGGEMRLKGKNPAGGDWRIGIDRPNDGNFEPGVNVQVILKVTNKGLATSGNYRRFYTDESGRKIAHTIDPRTGYPVNHNLLSCTVIADDCITADAFATAFMVVGLDSAKVLIEKYPELEGYFIYDDNGEYKVYYTAGMEQCIQEVATESTDKKEEQPQ